MTWDELCKKARVLDYTLEFNYIEDEKELFNDDTGLCFLKNGKMCYWVKSDCYTIATDKTYDEMFQIMELLK